MRTATIIQEARRTQLVWVGVVMIVLSLVVYQSGCGPSARQIALRTELAAVNTARDAFTSWDHDHQMEIVAKASSREDAVTKLESYRKLQEKVIQAFIVIYRQIAASALEDDKPDPVLEAARKLRDFILKLKPGQDPPEWDL